MCVSVCVLEGGEGGGVYSLCLKSVSCHVSLSTMDCLFDFNKACMSEKSHHLTNVSAMQGDKQGGAEGRRERERRNEGRKGRRGFLSCGRPFSSTELCQAVSGQKRNNHHSLSLRLCLCSSVFLAIISSSIFI